MPHVCGDEPAGYIHIMSGLDVCPTYVGMNRDISLLPKWEESMPHVCGDEPGAICRQAPPSASMPHVCGDEPFVEMWKTEHL